MSILNSVLKLFVGDKQQKDLKLLQPIVAKVKTFEASISSLSNDQLREKTCLLYTSPSPRDKRQSRMPSSA